MFTQVFNLKNRIIAKRNERVENIPSLLERMSTLLDEGYTLADSIIMLLPYHVKNIESWQMKIEEHLRNGGNIIELFDILSIPRHYLISIKIAEENGTLVETLKAISKEMEFNEKTKKKLGKLLLYPVILLLFLISIFVAFRTFFLPNIEQIIESRAQNGLSSLAMTKVFLYFPDVLLTFTLLITIVCICFFLYLKNSPIKRQIEMLLRLPIVSYFFKLHMTMNFSRMVGSLVAGGLSLQQALEILHQQDLNRYLKEVALKVKHGVLYGDSLSQVVQSSDLFFSKCDEFIKHGEKSGYLGRELMIYSDLLNEKMHSIIKISLSLVQPFFFVLIALSIIAAYLSILLPMYNIIEVI